MKILRSVAELREWRKSVGALGFVPTMGAFHEGHLALMRAAKAELGCCAVSLFVNPKQFGPSEDLSRYPRNEAEDAALAEAAGADILFCPSVEEIYPQSLTQVTVSSISDRWEGEQRPGHFDGVALVVLKLFNMVQPTAAYFGLKDLQQCAVIRQMTLDLNVPLELRFLETVRSPEGLALSSRNRYLSKEDLDTAMFFPKVLQEAVTKLNKGIAESDALEEGRNKLIDLGLEPDYLCIVDPISMAVCSPSLPEARIMAAVRFRGIRLLDNMPLG